MSDQRVRGMRAGIVGVCLVLALGACSKSSGPQVPTMPTGPGGAPAPGAAPVAPHAAELCPDGKPFVMLNGYCGGAWTVTRQMGAAGPHGGAGAHFTCDWSWKPVSCKAEGYSDVGSSQCYGVLIKEVGPRAVPPTQCASQFGNPPQRVGYNLRCCK